MAQLLPNLGHKDIYKDAGIPTSTLFEAKDQIALAIPVFLCPSDTRTAKGPSTDTSDLGAGFTPYVEVGYTNYTGVMGSNWEAGDAQWHNRGILNSGNAFALSDGTFYRGDFYYQKPFSAITDGLSQTAIVGEALPDRSKWCAWPYSNSANSTCAPLTRTPSRPTADLMIGRTGKIILGSLATMRVDCILRLPMVP